MNLIFQTIDSFPGAILVLAGLINVIIVAIFCIVFVKRSNFDLINHINDEDITNEPTKENLEVSEQEENDMPPEYDTLDCETMNV